MGVGVTRTTRHLYDHKSHGKMNTITDVQPTTASVAHTLQQLRRLPGVAIARRDPRTVPNAVKFLTRLATESCGYLGRQDVRGCREPRSCRDCLLHDECMVSEFTCARADTYSAVLDYARVGVDDNGLSIFNSSARIPEGKCFNSSSSNILFLANTTTYCAASDAACANCRLASSTLTTEEITSQYRQFKPFCLGANGCVCIGGCEESSAFLQVAEQHQCRFAPTRPDAAIYMGLAIAVLSVAIMIVTLYFQSKKQVREFYNIEREAEAQQTQQSSSTGTVRGLRQYMLDVAPRLHLDLYGWRHFQNELHRKEQELLAGAGDVSPVARPTAFEFAALPTAPDFEEEQESTAPTATNPHALASAPVFQAQTAVDRDDAGHDSSPSAPDFE